MTQLSHEVHNDSNYEKCLTVINCDNVSYRYELSIWWLFLLSFNREQASIKKLTLKIYTLRILPTLYLFHRIKSYQKPLNKEGDIVYMSK